MFENQKRTAFKDWIRDKLEQFEREMQRKFDTELELLCDCIMRAYDETHKRKK